MKTIENKKSNIPGDLKTYSDLIIFCVKNPPQGGFDIGDMRKRMKVMDVIEKGGESLEFEDAEFECVEKCIKNMRWPFLHKEVMDFVDYISELKKSSETSNKKEEQ